MLEAFSLHSKNTFCTFDKFRILLFQDPCPLGLCRLWNQLLSIVHIKVVLFGSYSNFALYFCWGWSHFDLYVEQLYLPRQLSWPQLKLHSLPLWFENSVPFFQAAFLWFCYFFIWVSTNIRYSLVSGKHFYL